MVDNFARETVIDVLVCEGVCERHGNVMVEALNMAFNSPTSQEYYMLVNNEYELYDAETLYL